MAGDDISLIDNDVSHDHSYYGNGCSKTWSEGGCETAPNSSRITKTRDNEDQEMGVYYNFQAATSGTGGTMTGQNSNAPDTFCPLGWQLPYSGTGGDYYDKSKSWKYLQDNFYSEDLVMKYPLSYIGSGSYDLSKGIAYQFGGYGYYFSGTNYSSSTAFILRPASWVSQVTTEGVGKNSSGTLRCVKFLASFIDGTVEGTDVETGNIDQNRSHDHTFIGNGCLPGYSAGGSSVSCSTRILTTFDDDNQKNGTYYNYQATTLGTGAAISTKNALTPDTFCPLGWQLPYGGTDGDYYDKSKSWNYLISAYNFSDDNAGTRQAMSYPVEFIKSGQYDWNTGKLYNQNSTGTYWTVNVYNNNTAFRNEIYLGHFTIYQLDKLNGYALRCV